MACGPDTTSGVIGQRSRFEGEGSGSGPAERGSAHTSGTEWSMADRSRPPDILNTQARTFELFLFEWHVLKLHIQDQSISRRLHAGNQRCVQNALPTPVGCLLQLILTKHIAGCSSLVGGGGPTSLNPLTVRCRYACECKANATIATYSKSKYNATLHHFSSPVFRQSRRTTEAIWSSIMYVFPTTCFYLCSFNRLTN